MGGAVVAMWGMFMVLGYTSVLSPLTPPHC